MSLFGSISRIVESTADIVDKTTVKPIADALDLAADGLKGLDADEDRRKQ